MRRILLIYILLFVIGLTTVNAQFNQGNRQYDENGRDQYGNQIDPAMLPDKLDSANVEVQGLPPTLYMWRIKNELGDRIMIPADTAFHHFQNSNLTEGLTGHYNYLANMGSPRLSRIFFDRRYPEPTIFMEPFSSFFIRPTEFNFTNSNVPYTNLTYHKAGNKVNGEERFNSYFSVNVNKKLAFGFNIDYLYGRGYYNNQGTSYFNAAFFGSYISDRYQIQAIYSNNYLKTNENGGITDDRYITAPEDIANGVRKYESINIPTVLDASANRNHNFYVFMTQRYNLGFRRDIPKAENDTTPTKQEFVPVTSFIHTFQVERSRHNFRSKDNVKDYYQNTYLDPEDPIVRDSTIYVGVKNTIGIALLEGFNKYAKAGLTAFASHKLSKYSLMNLEGLKADHYNENEIFVGGELSKREGNILHYHAIGEVGLAGTAIGQFNVKGDIDLNFPLWKDTVGLVVRGEVSNRMAPFYMRHYHSKHFWWDDDMAKEFHTRVEGELNIARWRTRLNAGVENIKNFTYFNQQALPAQKSGSLQVVSARFNQDFKLGIFHLDNEVVWQKSSDQDVLPLPDFSLYHNFYMQFKLAKKVLSVELGADVRYFSKYFAPAYMPATEQFYLQPDNDRVKIGGYPIVNVYANLHLKRTRFYVMMYHVNQGISKPNYFLAPHYPINPRVLKFGLSWNFYD
ncbi:putative porin [Bacteroides bouchesdurhonensis]|uniref:putative porin n=1 Tax=Bacteroides bouchesdurhonensis TaxID=1841855 RepID=UPI0011DD57CC|nr:putative porin [Bacteroides bouchesdurhonensis]